MLTFSDARRRVGRSLPQLNGSSLSLALPSFPPVKVCTPSHVSPHVAYRGQSQAWSTRHCHHHDETCISRRTRFFLSHIFAALQAIQNEPEAVCWISLHRLGLGYKQIGTR